MRYEIPNCLVPIHQHVAGGGLESFGSGILIRIQEHHFLLSAAHVLNADHLWLPAKPQFIELDTAGRVFTTSPNLEAAFADEGDLGYVALALSTIEPLLENGLQFLEINKPYLSRKPGDAERYIVSGYPSQKSTTDADQGQIENTRWDLSLPALPKNQLRQFRFDPAKHVAMLFDQSRPLFHGQELTPVPRPNGMSGGAFWYPWSDSTVTLVGIITDHFPKKKIIRGTRVTPMLIRIIEQLLAQENRRD